MAVLSQPLNISIHKFFPCNCLDPILPHPSLPAVFSERKKTTLTSLFASTRNGCACLARLPVASAAAAAAAAPSPLALFRIGDTASKFARFPRLAPFTKLLCISFQSCCFFPLLLRLLLLSFSSSPPSRPNLRCPVPVPVQCRQPWCS